MRNFLQAARRQTDSNLPAIRRQEPEPPTTVALQVAHIAQRFGGLDPALLATLANLAFGEARAQ